MPVQAVSTESPYSGRFHSRKSLSCNAPIALAITGPCGLSIGHLVVGNKRIAILLSLKFLLVTEVFILGDKSVVFGLSFGNQITAGKMCPTTLMAGIHIKRQKES